MQSVKDCSVTEAMTHGDVDQASFAKYTAIQTIKNPEIGGYGQVFEDIWNRSGVSTRSHLLLVLANGHLVKR